MTHKELIAQLRSLASQLQNTAVTLTEALPPKAEQTQPPVQQPDAALSSDEPPGSAAGNPDGDSLEAFVAWCGEQREALYRHARNPVSNATEALADEWDEIIEKVRQYQRRGAA